MALIPCRECGKEIADSAPACPDCGAPSKLRGYGVMGQNQVKH